MCFVCCKKGLLCLGEMNSIRGAVLHVLNTPKAHLRVKYIEYERSLWSILCRSVSSSRNDGLPSQDFEEDDKNFSVRRPARHNQWQSTRNNSRINQKQSRSGNYRSRQQQDSEFEEFDKDFEDLYGDDGGARHSYRQTDDLYGGGRRSYRQSDDLYGGSGGRSSYRQADDLYGGGSSFRQQGFQNSRYSNEVGANLKKKNWDLVHLSPLEKNFYIEHPSLTQKTKEDIDAFYKNYNIVVQRGERPIPISHFNEVNFPEEINKLLKTNEWTEPTPIQSVGWPIALSGKNVVGIAQTGSGKTLGFILPALVHTKHQRQIANKEGPVVLVLAPTRELAQQIKGVAIQYGRPLGIRTCCLFGGQSKLVQAKYLSEGPEIVVATPGRLLDFMEMGAINLDRTSYVVLDEADRMLDMGFEPQIRKVLGQTRPDRQMLMWSATWPKEIQQLAHDFLGEFTQVNIGSVELMANPNIQQHFHVCSRQEKINLLVEELNKASKEGPQKTLIFTQTKTQADFLTMRLVKLRFKAMALHGDKTQLMRDQTLNSFKNGNCEILVATDVASRGLDVNDIKLVINYDYPNTVDDYIHRIGRTARATKTGTAVSFLTSEDAGKVDDLVKVLKEAHQNVPEELLELSSYSGKKYTRSPSQSRFEQKSYNRYGYNRRNSW